MGAVFELIAIGGHLVCVAIDMMLILLIFRMLGRWRQIRWIQAVNRAASEPVNCLLGVVGQQWRQLTSVSSSANGTLALSLATPCLARFVLCGLTGLLLL